MHIRARQVFAGIAITAALFTTAAPAVAFGPPPGPYHVGCDVVWMDPPNVGYIEVTIHGTLDGQPVPEETVPYIGNDTHKAFFPKTRALLLAPGSHTFDFFWTWTFGEGESEHAEGTITCVSEPTTSTTPTSVVTSTTESSGVTSTTTCTEPRGCCLADCNGPSVNANAAPQELPHTGSSSLPLGFGGFVLAGAGAALLAIARRKKAHS